MLNFINLIQANQITIGILLLLVLNGCDRQKLSEYQPNIREGGRAVALSSSPNNDQQLIVVSETGGLFYTASRGEVWAHVSKTLSFQFTDVMFHPKKGNIVLATADRDSRTTSGGGVYRSTDYGATWSRAQINASDFVLDVMAMHCLSFDEPSGRLWAGANLGLYYSDDDGKTWEYQSGTSNLGNQPIHAVLNPDSNKMVVLTNGGLKVSTDGGYNWRGISQDLPSPRIAGEHNQIAVSPLNKEHLYFVFNARDASDSNNWKNYIYYSKDLGFTWQLLDKFPGIIRPPNITFSRSSLSGKLNTLDLYYSSGGCLFTRRTVTHGTNTSFGEWEKLQIDHCDVSDIEIGNDGATPILLISDGGIHKTKDKGATWIMIESGEKGYGALQMTEMTGQLTDDDGQADLYFGTQDNNIWASPNEGVDWPNALCCEGFYLDILPIKRAHEQNVHNGAVCTDCTPYKSDALLQNVQTWDNKDFLDAYPALVDDGVYVQEAKAVDSVIRVIMKTQDFGETWTQVTRLTDDPSNFPLVTGHASEPVVYLTTQGPKTNDVPLVSLYRISGLLDNTAVLSEITGFGNIGIFKTEFAWYEVFGVKPTNPNFIIVPDISNKQVLISRDGGLSWEPNPELTNLITNNGEFEFAQERFSQITSFGFDPYCREHIIAGTLQAGIFESFDDGLTWSKVKNSEKVPFVSSFYFPRQGNALITTYGRGMWKYLFTCDDEGNKAPKDPFFEEENPYLFHKDILIPMSEIAILEKRPRSGFFLLKGGVINEIVLEKNSSRIAEIYISNGIFEGYDFEGNKINLNLKVKVGDSDKGILRKDAKFKALLKNGLNASGLYVTGLNYNGIILNTVKTQATQLPRIESPTPGIYLNVNPHHGILAKNTNGLFITTNGYDPKFPLEVFLNDVPLDTQNAGMMINRSGNFIIPLPSELITEITDVIVKQQTDSELIEDSLTIHLSTGDTPERR